MFLLRRKRVIFSAKNAENNPAFAANTSIITAESTEIMPTYIHQLSNWPEFTWNADELAKPLAAVWQKQGRLTGKMQSLGFPLQDEAVLKTLTEDVLKSSEIEGESLDKDQVRSSIARRLGRDVGALAPADRDVEGVVEMMLDATQNFAKPLTDERLFGWHASLFPTGRSNMRKIVVGVWRDDATGPMRWSQGRKEDRGSTTKRRQRPGSPKRWRHFSNGSKAKINRPNHQGCPRPSLVRHHSPV